MTTFPGFDRIFALEDPFNRRYLRADIDGIEEADANGALLRNAWVPDRPVIARHAMYGAVPADVVWTRPLSVVLFHERVIASLEEEQLTGWTSYRARVYDKAGMPHDTYRAIAVTGRCGPLDRRKSVPLTSSTPDVRRYKGLFFDETQWDGSDFFMAPDETLWVFTTDRVRRCFESRKFKNVSLTPIAEVVSYEVSHA